MLSKSRISFGGISLICEKRLKSNQTISLLLAFCAMSAFQLSLGPTLADIAAQTGTGLNQTSIVLSAMFAGYLSGSFLNGKFIDHVAANRLIAFYLLLGAICLALIPFIPHLWLVTLLCFIMGFSSGGIDLGSNVSMVWIHGEKSGTFLNILHAFFGFGAFLVPLIIGKAVEWTEKSTNGYWFIAVMLIPIVIFCFFVPLPQKKVQNQTQNIKSRSSFWVLVFFGILMGCSGGTLNSISSWSFSYARVRFPLMPENAAYQLTSLLWATSTITRLLTLPIVTKIKPKTFLIFDLSASLLSLIIIQIWNQSELALWIGTIGLGISLATIFPQTLVYCNQLSGTSGSITRWLFLGQSTGNVIIPWVVGQFFINPGETSANFIHFIFLFGAFLALQGINLSSRKGFSIQ